MTGYDPTATCDRPLADALIDACEQRNRDCICGCHNIGPSEQGTT